jgi:hypothetical protein
MNGFERSLVEVVVGRHRSTGETRFRIFRIEHREKHRSLRMTHAAVS